VPRCASSKRPTRWAMAPVKAPRSWPNSSLSSNPAGIAEQSSFTNAWPFRVLRVWRARAINALPVPVSPKISTVESVGATVSTWRSTWRNASLLPDDFLEVELGADLGLEIHLLLREWALERGDLVVGDRVLHGDSDLLRHIAKERDVVVYERVLAHRAHAQVNDLCELCACRGDSVIRRSR
jgi:hypothetical protein